MREGLRSARLILGAALAADRRGVFVSGLLGILAWIAVPLQAVAIKLFIDAGGRADATALALSAIALSVVLGGMWYVNSLRQLLRVTVSERTHHELDRRLQRLLRQNDRIQHLERPDYLHRVLTLPSQSRHFGDLADRIH